MDKRAVMDALDEAIVNVAKEELNRLRGELSPHAITRNIANALRSLESLQQGHQPDYDDPWVALFYLLWYQPKQINLTYSMIKATADRHPPKGIPLNDSGKLLVVDFGCGSLAMQFGIMLAVADAFERGQFVSSIHIDSFDTSQAMISLGEAVWDEFKMILASDGRLDAVSLSFDAITTSTTTDTEPQVERRVDEDCWLSAVHVVYDSNKEVVQNRLEEFKDQLNPDMGFITTFSDKVRLARLVSPFGTDVNYRFTYPNPRRQFNGNVELITNFRTALSAHILQQRGLSLTENRFIENYLNNPCHMELAYCYILGPCQALNLCQPNNYRHNHPFPVSAALTPNR